MLASGKPLRYYTLKSKQNRVNEMAKFDYFYTNNANEFAVVKFDLDGNFLAIDCDPTDEELIKMENMEDVEGWEIRG